MAIKDLPKRISNELGVTTILGSTKDVHLLLLTRCLRMFAYGSSTLILAMYFAALGHTDTMIGLFMTLTLVGDVLISLALTLVADSLGRRRILVIGALLMSISGAIFATFSNYWILLSAAVVGVISPSGNEIGPFRAVEESTLAQLSEAKTRSDVFAWYVVFGTLGTAGGSLSCGWVVEKLQSSGWSDVSAFRTIFWVYTLIGLLKAGLTLLLSPACEMESKPKPIEENQAFLDSASGNTKSDAPRKKSALAAISPKSRIILLKLCALFFFDSLASGMVPFSLIAFYMDRKFAMPQGQLGTIMSAAQFVASVGNIFAASIAKRIGLIKTMVFTHLPSAIFLALIPAPTSVVLTVILLVARGSLSSMDQAPRSAFLSAVVLPEERTAVMGIVNTVKTASQSSGPLITGLLAGGGNFWIAFVIAGSLKASYDLGMLTMFVHTKIEGEDSKKPADTEEYAPVEQVDGERDSLEFSENDEIEMTPVKSKADGMD